MDSKSSNKNEKEEVVCEELHGLSLIVLYIR